MTRDLPQSQVILRIGFHPKGYQILLTNGRLGKLSSPPQPLPPARLPPKP
jgi:hypothetical protein